MVRKYLFYSHSIAIFAKWLQCNLGAKIDKITKNKVVMTKQILLPASVLREMREKFKVGRNDLRRALENPV